MPTLKATHKEVNLDEISTGGNYRRSFSNRKLRELANSIKYYGQIKPIIVHYNPNSREYELLAGERRYLALKLINSPTAKAMVYHDLTQEQKLLIQLSENIQEKIPTHEIADSLWYYYKGYLSLKSGKNLGDIEKVSTYEDLPAPLKRVFSASAFARTIKRDEGFVREAFRYQTLSHEIKDKVDSGKLLYTHALQLTRIQNKKEQLEFMRKKGDKLFSMNKKELSQKVGEYLKKEFNLENFNGNPSGRYTAKYRNFDKISYFMDGFDNILSIDKPLAKLLLKTDKAVTLDDLLRKIPKGINAVTKNINKQSDILKDLQEHKKDIKLRDQILANNIKPESKNGLEDKVGFQYKIVLTSQIEVDPNQPRKTYNEKDLDDLADSLKEIGQLEPIFVRELPKKDKSEETRYMVIAGNRRRKAAGKARLKEMKVMVAPTDLTDASIRVLQLEEDKHEKVPPNERSWALKNLKGLREQRDNKEYSLGEFSKQVSYLSVDTIKKAFIFTTLDERIRELEDKGLLKYSVAIELVEIEDLDKRYGFALEAIVNNWGVQEVRNIIQKRAQEKQAYAQSEKQSKSFFEQIETLKSDNIRRNLITDLTENLLQYNSYLNSFDSKMCNNELMVKKFYLSKLAFESLERKLKKALH